MMKRRFIDVQVIYHKLEQRTLSAAYKFYCGKNLEDAHTAEADTRATVSYTHLDVYKRQMYGTCGVAKTPLLSTKTKWLLLNVTS